MPAYQKTPFKPSPNLITSGRPSYLFGSYNDRVSPTQGYVLSDAIDVAGTTATVTFQATAGYALNTAQLHGETITIVGAGNNALFNVTNASILTAVTNILTGICTVTFTIVGGSLQATTADTGSVLCSVPEIADTVATFTNNAAASVPVAVPFNNPDPSQGRVLTAVVNVSGTFNSQTVVVDVQEALQDFDSEYATIAPAVGGTSGHLFSAGSAGYGVASYTFLSGRFYRFVVSMTNSSGVSLSVIAKING